MLARIVHGHSVVVLTVSFHQKILRLTYSLVVFLGSGLVSPLVADEVIRIMAGNLTSGNNQNYNSGEGGRIFKGLQPDIALVQEFNYLSNSATDLRAWVTGNFGAGFSYSRQSGSGISIPNGIVSRYTIRASGTWDDTTMTNRDYSWAQIDIPGDKDLWAVSVHISSGGGATQRNQEAGEIKTYIQQNITAGDYYVLGGDFNTTSRTESCINTLSSVVVTTGPWPVDQAGDGDTNAGRNDPYDWVMADPGLHARKTPLIIGTQSFTNGLVFDSRVYYPLPPPVLVGDSGATGMQHMGVIRSFLIPTNDAPLIASAANSSSTETVTDPDFSVYEIVRGAPVGLTVAATDDGGEAALKYTWSLSSGPGSPVAFAANATNAAKNTTATFQAIGNYTFTVTVQDVAGLSVASSVKVRVVQAASSIALNPPTTTLVVNAIQQFNASLRDQFSLAMATQPVSFAWSGNGGGTLNSSGRFTATTAGGPFVVTVSSGAFSGSSSVTVTRAAATISLTNLSQTYDGSAKSVTATTTPAGRAVSILYNGAATLPVNVGSYAVTASITDVNYQGSSTATFVITPDAWASWKNSHFTPQEQIDGLASDLADPDSDAFPNLAEYALGANPRVFTPPLPGTLDANGLSITFTRPANIPGIHYAAEASGDLKIWSPVPLELLSPGAVETLRARDPLGPDPAMPRFLRLRFLRD